jgi:hypothetical protein
MALDDRGKDRDDARPELRYMPNVRTEGAAAARAGLLGTLAVLGVVTVASFVIWRRR